MGSLTQPDSTKMDMEADDNALISGWLSGDDTAADKLVSLYGEYVFRLCIRLTRDPDAAEDLAQDVWIRVFKGLATFNGDSSLRTWLYTVVDRSFQNNSRNTFRRQLREQKVFNDDAQTAREIDPDSNQSVVVILDPAPDQAKNLEISELRNALHQLEEPCRSILILRYFEDFAAKEIASALGISLSTVNHKSMPCLRRLGELLQHSGGGGVQRQTEL